MTKNDRTTNTKRGNQHKLMVSPFPARSSILPEPYGATASWMTRQRKANQMRERGNGYAATTINKGKLCSKSRQVGRGKQKSTSRSPAPTEPYGARLAPTGLGLVPEYKVGCIARTLTIHKTIFTIEYSSHWKIQLSKELRLIHLL